MRVISDHKVNGLNEAIEINAVDEPGPGGANHKYQLLLKDERARFDNEQKPENKELLIEFQNGPVKDSLPNGFTNESLVAVVIDRMRGFQLSRDPDGKFSSPAGKYACRENALALTHLEEALMWLQKRTRDRLARGVEGTATV